MVDDQGRDCDSVRQGKSRSQGYVAGPVSRCSRRKAAGEGMRRWRTGLGPADVQDARGEIDLIPTRQPSRFRHSRPCSASSRLCRRSRSKPVPTAEARGLSSGSTFAGGIQVDFATGVLHVRSAKAGTPATHPLTVRALGWRKGADSCQESDPDLLGSPGSEVFNLPGHERSAGDGED